MYLELMNPVVRRIFSISLYIIILHVCSVNHVLGQNKIETRLYFLPVGARVSTGDVVELGLGIYEFNYSRPWNVELGCVFSKKIIKRLFVDVGIALKYQSIHLEYIIHDPYIQGEIFGQEKRYLNKIDASPQVALQYSFEKIYFSVGLETSLRIAQKSDLVTGSSPIYIFFGPDEQSSAFLTVRETDLFLTTLGLHHGLFANAGYRINSKWHVNANFKFQPFKHWAHYGLLIEGKTPDLPQGNHTLNDTRILNKLMLLGFGFSYSFN